MKYALISVYDKTGIADLARELNLLGYRAISTGGTYDLLKKSGVDVISVSEITNFPECLDGRVKTLHPSVHGGILAKRDDPGHVRQMKELSIEMIDIVAVNLYPFKTTILKPGVSFEDAIENIDIGGPAMLRSAAKNHRDVTVVTDPADYDRIVREIKEEGEVKPETKLMLAYKVFAHTASYDALIAGYLREKAGIDAFTESLTLTYEKAQDLRYGENPFQKAAFYRDCISRSGIAKAEQLHGKELSFNNINDANGAVQLLAEFEKPSAVAVKHANPCGAGSAGRVYDAYMKAYDSDPVSIYGGIVAINREIDEDTAREIGKIFVEIVIGPSFSEKALEILMQKKNIRILRMDMEGTEPSAADHDMKKVLGGLLYQTYDNEVFDESDMKCVTNARPTEDQITDMKFCMKVAKHVKSNAIVLAKNEQTIGIGPGQVNRISAVELAVKFARDNKLDTKGSVLASDAYFPFDDCVRAANEAGISAIIQPGGSIRDQDSVDACNEYGISMIFTGKRHFRH